MGNVGVKFKILYIEDENDVRENVSEVLRMEGFDVIEAEDANKGLKRFMSEKPDMVISDILMPKITGFDLLKKIRILSQKFNPQVPFIFLSALGHKADIIKGTTLTANDYLVKPVDLDILIAKIKEKLSTKEVEVKNHNKDIKGVYDKISGMFLKELDAELHSLLKLIGIFKDETFGPLGHRGYTTTANKMYLITQRLKTIANNAMNKNILIQKMKIVEEVIDTKNIINDLIDYIGLKAGRDIKLELFNDYEHKIKFNLDILKDTLRYVLMQIIKITTNDKPIRINFFIDHEKNFVFAFHGLIAKGLKGGELDVDIELKYKRDKISGQGGDIDFNIDNENAIALISIPEYKVLE